MSWILRNLARWFVLKFVVRHGRTLLPLLLARTKLSGRKLKAAQVVLERVLKRFG